jgi:hypothetical protein
MQRRYEAKTRGERLIEHIVWNIAAGAALAVMILLLLGTLRWLDQVTPQSAIDVVPMAPTQLARPLDHARDRQTDFVAVNRPSG